VIPIRSPIGASIRVKAHRAKSTVGVSSRHMLAREDRAFARDFVLCSVLLTCIPLPVLASVELASGSVADAALAMIAWMAIPTFYWWPLGAFLKSWPGRWFSRLLLGFAISVPLYLLALVLVYAGFGAHFAPRNAAIWGIYLSSSPLYFGLVCALYLAVRRGGQRARVVRLCCSAAFVAGLCAPLIYALRVDRYRPTSRSTDDLVIVNARIVDPEHDRIIDGLNVHVNSGRISTIVDQASDPNTSAAIDAHGAYLLPGLIDVHTHLQAPIKDVFAPFRTGYFLEEIFGDYPNHRRSYLEQGVTSIRDDGGSAVRAFALRRALASGTLLGPRLFLVGRLVTSPRGHPVSTIWSHSLAAAGAIQAADAGFLRRELERDLTAGPPDAVKFIYGTIGRAPTRLRADLLQDGIAWATAHHLVSIVHAETAEEVSTAATAGATGIEHVASIGRLREDLLKVLTERSCFVDATFGELRAALRLRGAPSDEIGAALANGREAFKRIFDAGVPVVVGTDAPLVPYGSGLHDELDELRLAGLTPAQALTAATVHNAAYLGQPRSLGRIEPGYRADLVLADGNPLQDPTVLRRPLWVMLNGTVVAGRAMPAHP
jgi:imidazolonepropionase-like amidohydrolase